MARPTTWRRGFGSLTDAEADDAGTFPLAVLQPGETLGGCWWTYRLYNAQADVEDYPLQNSTTVVGLSLQPMSETPWTPLGAPFEDWLWWEQATFDPKFFTQSLLGTEVLSCASFSQTGNNQRKIKAMRKAAAGENSYINFSWQTALNGVPREEALFKVQASVSALIILP